ncbi:hypothetical protein BIV60_20590 [Bacillus sp. MUM 116]|uniref:N-acetylmuramoyl-L-alanine amidase n=1 Tax=Bacillus sp. MUM 116 TaxID=1678002 RepID=UPI0008F5C459|nr:N-acetylmuramoyl-L-alanine amidase [Bacillus sp. MUM 116]OIK10620.1 hypothetical protein BIV60_20590 [Bacillus sp. MUM 116]
MLTAKMKKLLTVLSITAIPLVGINQTALAKTTTEKVTVTASHLNVRESPDISGKVKGIIHKGESYKVIQKKNNWDQIKLKNNQIGWASHAYLAPTNHIGATVKVDFLNIRQGPNISSPVIGKLYWGAKIKIQAEQAGWAKMVSSTGVTGWVSEIYITKDAQEKDKHQTQPATSKTTTEKKSAPTQDKKNSSPSTKPSQTSTVQMKTESIKTATNQGPLGGKTIVLDPGHGGVDVGTTSITGTHEKTLTLETAKAVEKKLKNAGANVIMTRTNDTYISLEDRARLSNRNDADAFISFHYNWIQDSAVSGLTDFYFQKSRDNELASKILNEVVKTTKLNNVGTRYNNLSVLRNNSQPSTLIELGFLSNKKEDAIVESDNFRENVAEGVYSGLLDYFSNK